MAVFLLKRLTLQTIRTENNCIRCFNKHTVRKTLLSPTASAWRLPSLVHAQCLSTDEGAQDDRKKKASKTLTNTGRKIHARIIRVFSEEGTDLGPMHRADTIRLMEERALRLVQRDADAEPPEYQLMTGAQIHQERLRLREEEKAKPKSGEYFAASSLNPLRLQTSSFKIPRVPKRSRQWEMRNQDNQHTHGFVRVPGAVSSPLAYNPSFFVFPDTLCSLCKVRSKACKPKRSECVALVLWHCVQVSQRVMGGMK